MHSFGGFTRFVSRPCRDESPVFYSFTECLMQKAITDRLYSLLEKRIIRKVANLTFLENG